MLGWRSRLLIDIPPMKHTYKVSDLDILTGLYDRLVDIF